MPAKKTTAKSAPEVKPPINDVAQPGQSAPDNTARPIIVNNHQLKQDPMVTDSAANSTSAYNETPGEAARPAEPAQEKLERPKKIVIQPLHDDIKPEDDPAPPAAAPTASKEPEIGDEDSGTKINVAVKTGQSAESGQPTEDSQPNAAAPPPKATDDKPTATGAATLTPPVKPAANADKQLSPEEAAKVDEQAKERLANLQKLVDNKTYFLPINTVGKRHGRRMVWLGLALVVMLAVAWFDLALDGGLVPNTYNLPHTHLLRKK